MDHVFATKPATCRWGAAPTRGVPLDLSAPSALPIVQKTFELYRPKPLGGREEILLAGAGDDLVIGEGGRDFLIGGVGLPVARRLSV